MSHSIETQMLNALEYFHYSNRFRKHLFLLVLKDKSRLQELMTDIRVLNASLINLVILNRDSQGLEDFLELWRKRGCSFLYSQIHPDRISEDGFLQQVDQQVKTDLIPVFSLDGDSIASQKEGFDQFALDFAHKVKADKIFFFSEEEGLEIEGHLQSHITPERIRQSLSQGKKTNFEEASLLFLADQSQKKELEIVLLKDRVGNLFEEVFTHKGKGTLLTREYPNEIRQAMLSDIFDLTLLMKPYVHSGQILPVSEEEMTRDAHTYWVYTINHSIIATAKLKDYNEAVEVAKFCTLPRYQGKGMAKQLANCLIQEARERRKKYIFALSIEEKMWNFFTGLGFKEQPREELPESWRKDYDFSRKSKAFILNL
ncbi:MAG: GNAT family N-acetyltransferase [Deltaproteobacteria bacterium]|nr:GNAT family N-acetyltransferase [Deltaproteobacteria bacterium]